MINIDVCNESTYTMLLVKISGPRSSEFPSCREESEADISWTVPLNTCKEREKETENDMRFVGNEPNATA